MLVSTGLKVKLTILTFAMVGQVVAMQPMSEVSLVSVADVKMAAAAERLEASGAKVLAVLPNRGLLVAAGSGAGRGLPVIEAVETSRWRADDALAPVLSRWERAVQWTGGGLVLGLAPTAPWESLAHRLTVAGAEVRWSEQAAGVQQLGLWVSSQQFGAVRDALCDADGLVWAELQSPSRLANEASVWRVQSGVPGDLSVHAHGLRGQDQLVAVLDTGLDVDMCFFSDPEHGLPALNDGTSVAVSAGHRKVHAVDFLWDRDWPDPGSASWDSQGHGTHVAGSVAGDSNSDQLHQGADGMAPAARLVVQDGGFAIDRCGDLPGLGCPMRPLEPVLLQAWRQGARVHSNSWGDEEDIEPFNRYTERTADFDRFVWQHPEMVIVAAAGNAGPFDDTVGSPSTGKNVLSVGAALHGDLEPPCVVSFSSRGWTDDGRIKPDVVAPGSMVVSADNDTSILTDNCGVWPSSGTSMACPTVAGLAALVRQYFMDGFWPSGRSRPADGFEPSSALVRALLIAAAQDVSAPGCPVAPIPSRQQGWGLVELDTALQLAGDRERLHVVDRRSAFAGSDSVPFEIELRRTGGALKVVLVWTDPPSTSLAEQHLINDLDLTVVGPDGTWLGNQFAGGRSVTGGASDQLNPVEVVWLPETVAGQWRIVVTPALMRLWPQGFALVVVDTPTTRAPRSIHGRAR